MQHNMKIYFEMSKILLTFVVEIKQGLKVLRTYKV